MQYDAFGAMLEYMLGRPHARNQLTDWVCRPEFFTLGTGDVKDYLVSLAGKSVDDQFATNVAWNFDEDVRRSLATVHRMLPPLRTARAEFCSLVKSEGTYKAVAAWERAGRGEEIVLYENWGEDLKELTRVTFFF